MRKRKNYTRKGGMKPGDDEDEDELDIETQLPMSRAQSPLSNPLMTISRGSRPSTPSVDSRDPVYDNLPRPRKCKSGKNRNSCDKSFNWE